MTDLRALIASWRTSADAAARSAESWSVPLHICANDLEAAIEDSVADHDALIRAHADLRTAYDRALARIAELERSV